MNEYLCACDWCGAPTNGSVFEFCKRHWDRLKELSKTDDSFEIKRIRYSKIRRPQDVYRAVVALARDEGREEPEPDIIET